jgi:hypothetical protein
MLGAFLAALPVVAVIAACDLAPSRCIRGPGVLLFA